MSKEHKNGFWSSLPTFILAAIFSGVILLNLFIEVRGGGEVISEKSVTFADFSAVLLTTAAVIVAAMGVIMAIMAFFGFQHIRDQAKESASEASRKQMVSSLEEGGDLRSLVEERVDAIAKDKMMELHLSPSEKVAMQEAMDYEDEDEWGDEEEKPR